jgi:hypothetical protein
MFVIGGYYDSSVQSPKSDFYVFDNGKWTLLSEDTQKDGGPQFVSNLEMCIDSENQILYTFGGHFRSVYESLYKYDIRQKLWTKLKTDLTNGMPLKLRTECTMLFHPVRNQLFILGGSKGKDTYRDFMLYDIASDTVMEISRDVSLQGGPSPMNTVTSVLDHERDEIYVISGTTRTGSLENPETLKNGKNTRTLLTVVEFWVYRIGDNTWHQMQAPPTRARAAQMMVYQDKTIYMFGGREGEHVPVMNRLDDFWQIEITTMSNDEALRRAKFLVRSHRYMEMCTRLENYDPLLYLRTKVSEMVNHDNMTESLQFRELASHFMFGLNPDQETTYKQRMKLFDDLTEFVPDVKSKSRSIVDMVVQYETNL